MFSASQPPPQEVVVSGAHASGLVQTPGMIALQARIQAKEAAASSIDRVVTSSRHLPSALSQRPSSARAREEEPADDFAADEEASRCLFDSSADGQEPREPPGQILRVVAARLAQEEDEAPLVAAEEEAPLVERV